MLLTQSAARRKLRRQANTEFFTYHLPGLHGFRAAVKLQFPSMSVWTHIMYGVTDGELGHV